MHVDQHFTLIQTKLNRPLVSNQIVRRDELLARLDHQWDKRPLILVTAPAGYGKSTLLSSWLDTRPDTPATWLSLEKSDNDLTVFLHYFIAAIQRIFPMIGADSHSLLANAELPPVRALLATLINELSHIPDHYMLVLDDYHLINDPKIQELMSGVLTHAPATFHLALASRADPRLPIQKYRAQNMVTEIRANDLRFSLTEAELFLRNNAGRPLDEAFTTAVYERSEGWVTGLHLAALSLRRASNPIELPEIIYKNDQIIVAYLMSEVLLSQSEVMQEWLLKTAVFDRFSPDLCEAVLGGDTLTGKKFIKHLLTNNLFIISLDNEQRWYRYHHLFLHFLKKRQQQQYTVDETAIIHAAGSRWLAQNQLTEEALHHALAADDMEMAADLVAVTIHPLLNTSKWHLLKKWLSQLSVEAIQQRPPLLFGQAWMAFHQFTLWKIPPIIARIEQQLGDDADAVEWGEVSFFKGHDAYWKGQTERCLQQCIYALDRIPEANLWAKSETELFWGLAMQMAGRKTEALQQLYKWLYYEDDLPPSRKAVLMGALLYIHLLSAELVEAALIGQQIRDLAIKAGNTHIITWTSYLLGSISYRWNEMEDAICYFNKMVEHRYVSHYAATIDTLAARALVYQSLARPQEADAAMVDLLEFVWETNHPAYIAIARSCQAHLALLRGDTAQAVRHMQAVDTTVDTNILFYWLEKPRLTQCRVWIAQGTAATLAMAEEQLALLWKLTEDNRNALKMVVILLLQTEVYQQMGRVKTAVSTLNQALILANKGRIIQPFTQASPAIIPLFTHLHPDTATAAFIDTIQNAMAQRSATANIDLTHREKDVLRLLAAEFSNQEIASELHISPHTVKRHTAALYRKLAVNNRRQAVAAARRAGVIAAV